MMKRDTQAVLGGALVIGVVLALGVGAFLSDRPSDAELAAHAAAFQRTLGIAAAPTVCKRAPGRLTCSVLLSGRPARFDCSKWGCQWTAQ